MELDELIWFHAVERLAGRRLRKWEVKLLHATWLGEGEARKAGD